VTLDLALVRVQKAGENDHVGALSGYPDGANSNPPHLWEVFLK
jgi:hypothetical protein